MSSRGTRKRRSTDDRTDDTIKQISDGYIRKAKRYTDEGRQETGNAGPGAVSGSSIPGVSYLPVSGEYGMIGSLAFDPIAVAIDDGRIDITPNQSGASQDSSYVLVTAQGSPDDLRFIDGASKNGQIMYLQGTLTQIINLKAATISGIDSISGLGTVTVVTTSNHNLTTNDKVNIITTTNFNVNNVEVTVINPTSFTYSAIGNIIPESAGFVQNGNFVTATGDDVVLDGTQSLNGVPMIPIIFDPTVAGNGAWRPAQDLSVNGGSGVSFPILYPQDDFGDQSAVNLDVDISGNTGQNKKVRLVGDGVGFGFSGTPGVTVLEEFWFTFEQDGIGGWSLGTVPSTIKNSTLLDALLDKTANAKTTFHFITEDGGTTFRAELVDLSTSGGLLSTLAIDTDKDWAGRFITNLAGIDMFANSVANPISNVDHISFISDLAVSRGQFGRSDFFPGTQDGLVINVPGVQSLSITNDTVEKIIYDAGDDEFRFTATDIIAAGAGRGVFNIGHLDFVDNESTPAAAVSLYSDGTTLFTKSDINFNGNDGRDISSLFFLLAGQSIIYDSIGGLYSLPTGDIFDFSIDGTRLTITETSIESNVDLDMNNNKIIGVDDLVLNDASGIVDLNGGTLFNYSLLLGENSSSEIKTSGGTLQMEGGAIHLDVLQNQSIIALALATNYTVPDGGAHDFFVDDLIIPKFGITETSIESNVQLNMNNNKITNVSFIESDTPNIPESGFLRMAQIDQIVMRNVADSNNVTIQSGNDFLGNDAIIFGAEGTTVLTMSLLNTDFKDTNIISTGDILPRGQVHTVGDDTDYFAEMHSEQFIPESSNVSVGLYGLAKTGNTLYVNFDDTNVDAGFGIFEQGVQRFLFSRTGTTPFVNEFFIGGDPFLAGEEYRIQMGENSNSSAVITFTEGANDLLINRSGVATIFGVKLQSGGLDILYARSADVLLSVPLNMNTNDITNVGDAFADTSGTSTIGEFQPSNGGFDYILRNRMSWESDTLTYIEMNATALSLVSDDAIVMSSVDAMSISILASTGLNILVAGGLRATIQDNGLVLSTGTSLFVQSNFVNFIEIATPSDPPANEGRIFAADDGGVSNPFWIDENGLVTSMIASGGGDVVGPGSATDNAIARFDGTTGKLIQNSSVIISNAGDIAMGNSSITGIDALGFNITTHSINDETFGINYVTSEAAGIHRFTADASNILDIDTDGLTMTQGDIELGNGNVTGVNQIAFNVAGQTITDGVSVLTIAVGSGDVIQHVVNSIVTLEIAQGFLDLFDGFVDMTERATPGDPPINQRRIFVDSITGELSVRTNAGTTISLEGAGGGTSNEIVSGDSSVLVVDPLISFILNGGTVSTISTVEWLFGLDLDIDGNDILNPANIILSNNFQITDTDPSNTTFAIPAGDFLTITEGGEIRIQVEDDIILSCDTNDDILFQEEGVTVGSYNGGLNEWQFDQPVRFNGDIVGDVFTTGGGILGSASVPWVAGNFGIVNIITSGVIGGRINADADGLQLDAQLSGDNIELKTQGTNRARFAAEADGGITFFEPFEINDEMRIDGGNMILANDSAQCGFAVTNEVTSPGTEGTMQMPRTSDTNPTASELDTDFGSALGCHGLATLGGLPATPLYVIKVDTSPSTWRGILLLNAGNTIAIEIT